jgi:hypothetical protein
MTGKLPTRAELLAELDRLSHPARVRRVRTLAHAGRGSRELEALVASLATPDAFEASLALAMADTAGLEEHLLGALRHEAVSVRTLAAKAACRGVASDERLAGETLRAAPATRRAMMRRIRQLERTALADRLLPEVLRRWGPAEAARLLGSCSPALVERFLPDVAHATRSWEAFARNHDLALLAHVRRSLESAPRRARALAWQRLAPAIDALATRRATELLELALDHADPDAIPVAIERHLGRWTRLEPALVVELLLRPGYRPRLVAHGLPRGVLKGARLFSPEQLARIAAPLAENPGALARLLLELRPSARERVFSDVFSGDDTSARVWPDELLEALPHALRDREATRMLALRAIREDPDRTLAVTAFCEPDRSRAALESACRAATAEDRARGYSLLVAGTGRFRRGVAETLAFLGRLANEQDPVRLAALEALASWPASVIGDDRVPAIDALVDHVVKARDTSAATRGRLQAIARKLLQAGAASPDGARFRSGLATLVRLAGQAGTLALPSLERGLPRGAEHRIVAALAPMIRAANERESHGLVLGVARALGKRAHDVAPLQDLLEPLTGASPEAVARAAIGLWLEAPRTRDARVVKLLARDASAITIPAVFDHVHRRRQDLLDPYLLEKPIAGRFLTGKTLLLLPATSGFERWLPRQQAAHARLLERVANDVERNDWERAGAIRTLARIPVVEASALGRLVRSDQVPVIEAALAALAWTDRPGEALPVLLHHTDGDRARVAMYAVPRCARFLEPERLAAILDALLSKEKLRVTVHKEAVRLLGAFRSDASFGLLLRETRRPGLHRDVTIALGHAARAFLDREEAWPILEGLARSDDRFVAESVLDQSPEGIVPGERPRYVRLLLEVARHEDSRVRRRTWTALGSWSSGSEEAIARSASGRVLDLERGVEWREALAAVVEATRDGHAAPELVRLARSLAAVPPSPATSARRERDLPARQRLLALASALGALPAHGRVSLAPVLAAIGTGISEADETLWLTAAGLRVAAIDWSEPAGAASVLVALAGELGSRPACAGALAGHVARGLEASSGAWPGEAVHGLVDRLLESPTAERARLALAALAVSGRRFEWPEEAARRLRALRSHADPTVRAEALGVFTSPE